MTPFSSRITLKPSLAVWAFINNITWSRQEQLPQRQSRWWWSEHLWSWDAMAMASSSTHTHKHTQNGELNSRSWSLSIHWFLQLMCRPYLPSAKQNWLRVMTFLCLIGWFSHDSISDAIPEGVTFHRSCRKTDRKASSHNPQISESQQNQNHLEWSSGLLLHLWYLLRNCDPELVYMSSPERHTSTKGQSFQQF